MNPLQQAVVRKVWRRAHSERIFGERIFGEWKDATSVGFIVSGRGPWCFITKDGEVVHPDTTTLETEYYRQTYALKR